MSDINLYYHVLDAVEKYCVQNNKELVEIFCEIREDYPDLCTLIIAEIIAYGRITNNHKLFIKFSVDVNTIKPGITQDLLEEIVDV